MRLGAACKVTNRTLFLVLKGPRNYLTTSFWVVAVLLNNFLRCDTEKLLCMLVVINLIIREA